MPEKKKSDKKSEKNKTYAPNDTSKEREVKVVITLNTYGNDEQAKRLAAYAVKEVAVARHSTVTGTYAANGEKVSYTFDSAGRCLSHSEFNNRV